MCNTSKVVGKSAARRPHGGRKAAAKTMHSPTSRLHCGIDSCSAKTQPLLSCYKPHGHSGGSDERLNFVAWWLFNGHISRESHCPLLEREEDIILPQITEVTFIEVRFTVEIPCLFFPLQPLVQHRVRGLNPYIPSFAVDSPSSLNMIILVEKLVQSHIRLVKHLTMLCGQEHVCSYPASQMWDNDAG